MDCNISRVFLLFADRPAGTLSPPDISALDQHLAACPACRQLAAAQKENDDRLAQAMQAVPVPAGLQQRITARLADERRRRFRNRAVRYAGLAACLLLAVGLGAWWLQPPLPPVDLDQVAARLGRMPTTALEAEQALSTPDQPVQVPSDFNYALLVHCGPAQFQQRTVPTLDFQAANFPARTVAYARVYILRDTQFDLKSLVGASQLPNAGRYNVQVRWSVDGHYAFLVVYTGESLAPFQTPGLPPA